MPCRLQYRRAQESSGPLPLSSFRLVAVHTTGFAVAFSRSRGRLLCQEQACESRAVARRLRSTGDLATHLSGGLDSSSVTATAARLQQARGARVVAYTAVPQVPVSEEDHNRFADEREHAAAVAGLYPNVDHVLITSEGRPPWASLGSAFQLYQQPIASICNLAWITAIQDDAAARSLHVVLSGSVGNHTVSYTGLEMLPGLAAHHRWSELWRLMAALHRRRGMSWKSLLARTFVPHIPPRLQSILRPAMRPIQERGQGAESLLHPRHARERESLSRKLLCFLSSRTASTCAPSFFNVLIQSQCARERLRAGGSMSAIRPAIVVSSSSACVFRPPNTFAGACPPPCCAKVYRIACLLLCAMKRARDCRARTGTWKQPAICRLFIAW